jgi:hypothetical protein
VVSRDRDLKQRTGTWRRPTNFDAMALTFRGGNIPGVRKTEGVEKKPIRESVRRGDLNVDESDKTPRRRSPQGDESGTEEKL